MKNWPYSNPVDPEIYKGRTDWPKISIVTPSYNQGQYIEETILSILNQNYPNLEYIIIDGGSTDNTVEIIKKYEDRITYWVSEKDNGQADAINKGIEKCTGDIFNWINSDDYLEKDALFNIALNFDLSKYSLYAGSVNNFNNTSNFEIIENRELTSSNFILSKPSLSFSWHQPGVWFKMVIIRHFTPLETSLNYGFDFHIMLRLLRKYKNIKYENQFILVNFRLHDNSKTVSQQQRFQEDFLKARLLYYTKDEPNEIKKKIAKKNFLSYLWQVELQSEIQKRSKMSFTLFVIKNMIISPSYKISQFTFGALRQKILGYQNHNKI